jgi:2-C-methyl-D-erythritol 4-phosphate cytidylyltransferase
MDCIYLSAGLGIRMKKSQPKQFINLLGKPVFIYALEILESIDEIKRIILMYHPEYRDIYSKYLKIYNISKVELLEGGLTRQDSVFNGLQSAKSKRVLIHEAARPFISKELVLELIKYNDEKAVIPTIPITYTVSTGNSYMDGHLDRDKLHNVQLPQVFETETLNRAHLKAQKESFKSNEDGILVFRLGEKVRFIKGTENNLKITTPLDLIIGETLMSGSYQ